MTPELFLAFAGYAFATSITPGPNNTMLLASGAKYGFGLTIPLLLGINLGFTTLVLAVGLGLGTVFVAFPALHELLRYGGGVYLLYLAWKIASSSASAESSQQKPISFLQAASFQWVNPKGWIMAIGAIAAYAPSDKFFTNVLIVTVVFALVNAPCIAAWAAFGASLKGSLRKPRNFRAFNVGMALLLVASLYPLLEF